MLLPVPAPNVEYFDPEEMGVIVGYCCLMLIKLKKLSSIYFVVFLGMFYLLDYV
jgi:hypothetical protein